MSSSTTFHEIRDLWLKKDFEGCVASLEKAQLERSDDPKVQANLTAVKYIRDSQQGQQPKASDLQDIIGNSSQDTSAEPSKSDSQLPQSLLLLLNTATVLFNSHQRLAAAQLLRPAWQNISRNALSPGVNEDFILGIAFLFIDVEFSLKQYASVAGVIAWLEQKYDLSSDDGGETDSKISGIDNANSIHSGDFSHQASPGSPQTSDQVFKIVFGYNLSQLVPNWKARLYLATGNVKAAKREIRGLLALDLHNPQAISLKAELEALRGNLRRASRLISTRNPAADPPQGLEEVQMLSNLAYVQHCEGKHHTAVLCYSKALTIASHCKVPLTPLVDGEDIKAASEHIHDAEAAVLYSCGMEALLSKQYHLAYACLKKCAPSRFRDPLLWMRMAECCLAAAACKDPLVLSTSSTEDSPDSKDGTLRDAYTRLEETLMHGKECAANAVYLYCCQQQQSGVSPSSGLANGLSTLVDEPTETNLQRAVESHQSQTAKLGKLAALCTCTYLCLQLNQPASALQNAIQVLEGSEKGTQIWQLGQAYASEALCLLGKPAQASEHLQAALEAFIEPPSQAADIVKLENGKAADAEEAMSQLRPYSAEELHKTKVSVLVNLASTYFATGDMAQASEFAREGAEDFENRDAVLMDTYVQLCKGDINSALTQLKKFQLGLPRMP